jgi:hypothetical protein
MSGLMGLAWGSIAQTRATPFWQALAASGTWTAQEMGVYMARWRGVAGVQQVQTAGGSLMLGWVIRLRVLFGNERKLINSGADSSLYTGNINYISIPTANTDYWRIPLEAITVAGANVGVSVSATSSSSFSLERSRHWRFPFALVIKR